jgi:hypothetical protein
MDQRKDIKEGMIVRSLDGHKLGKVYAVGTSEFHIEKGIFFPKDYSVRYTEVSDIVDGDIILAHGRDSLRKFSLDDVSNADTLDAGAPEARTDTLGATTWRDLPMDRPASPSELSGITSDDLGFQSVSSRNTEGASASPFLTEEDRAHGRVDPALIPPPLPSQRPVMRASSLDESVGVVSPGFRDPKIDRQREEDYEAALLENDYRSALVEDELYEERRRSDVRGDADLDKERTLSFSDDDDGSLRRRGY